MGNNRTKIAIVTLAFFLCIAAVAMAASTSVIIRGWKPLIALAGGGEIAKAIKWFKEMAEFRATLIEKPDFDENTKRFLDDLWEAFEDFDLENFYLLLPEKSGRWRRLRISGRKIGSKYRIEQPPSGQKYEVGPNGHRRKLGDTSMLIRARQINRGDGQTYLIQSRLGWAIGVISWSAIVQSNLDGLRLIGSGDPSSADYPRSQAARGPAQARLKVIKTHRRLGPEDVEVIAVGWSAFPRVAEILNRIGRIEDLLVIDPEAKGTYQHLKPTFIIANSSLKRAYPRIVEYLDDISFVEAEVKIDMMEQNGRVLRTMIDTENRRVSFELYVKDGMILPFQKGRVRTDLPIDLSKKPAQKPWHLVGVGDLRTDVMGIKTHISNFRTHFTLSSNQRGATLKSRTTEVPDISVKGNALGILPSGLIDLFIPGSLESLTRDFITTACKGNEGKGIVVDTQIDQPLLDKPATFNIESAFEGTDNFMVKFGVSVMNDRMIPDEVVTKEIQKLLWDLHKAFIADLDRFAKLTQRS